MPGYVLQQFLYGNGSVTDGHLRRVYLWTWDRLRNIFEQRPCVPCTLLLDTIAASLSLLYQLCVEFNPALLALFSNLLKVAENAQLSFAVSVG